MIPLKMKLHQDTKFPDLLFVVTGGPGSGKSTLINALADYGLMTMRESGRQIIQNQISTQGNALPWSDPAAFARLMFQQEISQYEWAAQCNKIVVFDRGIPDVAGYLNLMQLPVPDYLEQAVQQYRYNRYVFVAPPWPEIFEQDEERKQTLTQAIETYHMMMQTYADYGYTPILLPLVPVAERVIFMIDQLRKLISPVC